MEEGEKKVRQEDCNEDKLGAGILTLTNKRIAFDKTKGRIMDFSKSFGETVIDVKLDKVKEVWKEGLLMKKVCFSDFSGNTYKFGVFNTGDWTDDIQDTINEYKANE